MNDYLTPQRIKLIEWFAKEAPSLGELYKGCLRILFSEEEIPGWARFVAHGVREIRNQLPFQVAGLAKSTKLEYSDKINQIAKLWEEEALPINGSLPLRSMNKGEVLPPNIRIEIPVQIYISISVLIGEHIGVNLNNRERASKFINFMLSEEKATDQNDPIVQYWWDTTEYFMHYTHENGVAGELLNKRPEFIGKFETFELILSNLIQEFYATTEILDAILDSTNTRTN